MKNLLNKKISVKSLLVVLITVCFSFTAIAATPATIQAFLSSNLTVKYNGVAQVMKDGNGNIVYPISYNGAIYVPLRPIAEMLNASMNYIEEQSTVEITSKTPNPTATPTSTPTPTGKSLLDVTDKGTKISEKSFAGTWQKVNNKSEFPPKKDNQGNVIGTYNDALKLESVYVTYYDIYPSTMSYDLSGNYNSLSFTAIANNIDNDDILYVEIKDPDKDMVIWSSTLKKGDRIPVNDVKLTNVKSIIISSYYNKVSNVKARDNRDLVYLCDPIVK